MELGDGYIGAGSSPLGAFLEDIKQLPKQFPKAKRLYVALGDNLPRLREWFGAFYHKPEMADQVAAWGSPQHIADEINRLKEAGVNQVLLNPVFDEEEQMERLAKEVLAQCTMQRRRATVRPAARSAGCELDPDTFAGWRLRSPFCISL